jgi:large subunit ribosomal protein L9
MEIILLEKIEKLGKMGDVVKVKEGFARNYLLPEKKALRANKANLAYFETQKAELEALNVKYKTEAEKIAEKMKGIKLIIVRQAAENNQLYGSVTVKDIRDALKEEGFKIETAQVLLNQPIKELGFYEIKINVHPEVSQIINVAVARSEDDAKNLEKLVESGVAKEIDDDVKEAAEMAKVKKATKKASKPAKKEENNEAASDVEA